VKTAGDRAAYAAARTLALAAQARARPADPQGIPPAADPPARQAGPCTCGAADPMMAHQAIVHDIAERDSRRDGIVKGQRTGCSILTRAGSCPCTLFTPSEEET
jgi:hypothetical protein